MRKRRSFLLLLLGVLLVTGVLGPECVAPLDQTKRIVAASATPDTLEVALGSAPVTIQAIIAFNSTLDASSVRVFDVTPGQPPRLLGSLAPAGITPTGQRFSADVSVPVEETGTLVLQVSAAYAGDPRRARSEPIEIVIEPPPFVAFAFDGDGAIHVPDTVPATDRIVVDLFDEVSMPQADELAAGFGATIVGFEAIGNLYVFRFPLDPGDPGAPAAFDAALAALQARTDLVERAFPDLAVATAE